MAKGKEEGRPQISSLLSYYITSRSLDPISWSQDKSLICLVASEKALQNRLIHTGTGIFPDMEMIQPFKTCQVSTSHPHRLVEPVASEGFEPPKALPADLQSDPFGLLGNSPSHCARPQQ